VLSIGSIKLKLKHLKQIKLMDKTPLKYTYWQDEDMWLGYLDEYKDYMTQRESMDELKENLIDIYR